MKYFFELTKEEALQINGGDAYELGKELGGWCANVVDYWHGLYDGIFN
jgi:hypothetical protein